MTPIDICNHALARLGEAKIISLTDATKPARTCSLLYKQTRDEVLRAHRWNFAKDRATLSLLTATPTFGWARAYTLPIDCLRVLSLNGETEEEGEEFDIEGRKLLTDSTTAQIVYIKKVEDSEQFDSLFCGALSVLLAAKMAVSLTGSQSRADDLRKEYESLVRPAAVKVDASESKPRKSYMTGILHASQFVNARTFVTAIPETES